MSRVLIVPTLVVASLGLAACGSSSASSGTGSGSGSTITVASSSDGCTLSATTTTSGTTTFSVTNSAMRSISRALFTWYGSSRTMRRARPLSPPSSISTFARTVSTPRPVV